MKIWTVTYHHRHGVDVLNWVQDAKPTEMEIIAVIEEFEPDRDEYFEVHASFEEKTKAEEACEALVEAYAKNPQHVDWDDVQVALEHALTALGLPEDYPEREYLRRLEERL